MAEHILVPLDASAFAAAAGDIAVQIAAGAPSRITALHVVNVREKSGNLLKDLGGMLGFEPAVVDAETAKSHDEAATAMVMDWVEKARAKGVEADGRVETGKVAPLIEQVAAEADLVVMGMRGETEERFPGQGGSMCPPLADHIQVPILFAVPDSAPLTAVAVGYDGSEGAKHALSAVRRFIQPLNLPVHVIRVSNDPSDAVLDEVDGQLPDSDVHKHIVSTEDASHQTLAAKARELDASLLVLGFQGHSAVKDFVAGSWTEHILLGAKLSVLVVH